MPRRFSISSSKDVHFWTLVLKTILILIKFPFQRYMSCRHLNFDPTYEIGHHSGFLPFWKLGTLGLVGDFVVCTKIFLDVMGPYKNAKQTLFLNRNFLRDSITGLGPLWILHCHRKQHIFLSTYGNFPIFKSFQLPWQPT